MKPNKSEETQILIQIPNLPNGDKGNRLVILSKPDINKRDVSTLSSTMKLLQQGKVNQGWY